MDICLNKSKKNCNKNGNALFCGKFDTFSINPLTGMIIKTQNDLMVADLIMRGLNTNKKKYQVQYHPLSLELK